MVKLEEFSNLTQKEDSILSKNYFETVVGSLKGTIVQPDLKFGFKASQYKTSSLLASLLLEHQKNNFLFRFKKRSNGQANFLMQYSPLTLLTNLVTSIEYKIGGQGIQNHGEPGFSIAYSSEKAKFKASLKDNPMVMNFGFTAGRPEYGLGLDWKFALNSQKYTEHALALWYHKKHTKIVAKHIGKDTLGRFEVSYYLKLSKSLWMASRVSTVWNTKSTNVQIGAKYQYDSSTQVKGKIDSVGKIGVALEKEVNKQVKAVVGVGIDTKEISHNKINDYSFGFAVHFSQDMKAEEAPI